MATRLKTVEFAFPALASMTDNTLTSLTQITIYLPETGTKTFRKVTAIASAMQTATATGNVTSRSMQCRLGAAAYTAHTNSNLYTGSGEDIFCYHAVDLTSHFTTNWSGTSMTMDAQVQFDGTATSVAWTNVNVTVRITYEYDDTSTTQIKTVYIPLDAPTGGLATTKPGTAIATIPNLSTELPEASKTFRSTHIVIQGNHSTSGSTDHTITMQLDATSSVTTNTFEGVSATDYFFRYVWDCSAVLNTSSSMGFYIWANTARFYHLQAWLVVTYEFDASASNDMYVSLLLPMDLTSPFGGSTSSDYQRGTRDLWIEEPGTITTKAIAYYAFWDQRAAITGINFRMGTGGGASFTPYSDAASVLSGNNAAMYRDDSAFTLDRGKNSVNFDVYRTDTTNLGFNISGFWIINYTAGKPADGYGAANHTVFWNLGAVFDGAARAECDISATAPVIPESEYYLTAVGTGYLYFTNSTDTATGVSIVTERLSAEGGIQWEPVYVDIGAADPETGLRHCYSQCRELFERWPGDQDSSRMDIETSRRWRCFLGNLSTSFHYLDLIFTYHTNTFTVSGTISGSGGGTVNIGIWRTSGEKVLSTSRTGDGSYSLTWYDDTNNLYAEAIEDSTHVGRSDDGTAT